MTLPPRPPLRRAPHWRRWSLTAVASWGFSAVAIVFVFAMAGLFLWQSLPVWRQEGWEYVSGVTWAYRSGQFGILPMIYGSMAVVTVALVLSAPVGIGAAIFFAEYLPVRMRLPLKMAVELLAGIPSVIYGLLGILFLRNWVYDWLEPFDPLSGDTLLTAGFLLAVMILPTITTVSDDALRGVGAAQREAARGLGLTRAEGVLSISLPQASAGILAAVLLAVGRALGETIAVFLVVGRQDNQWPENLLSLRPLIEAGQTLTSKLGGSETYIAYGDPLHWAAIVGLGLVLLLMTGAMTMARVALSGRRELA